MAVVVETKTTSKKRGTVRRRVSLVRKIGHYCLLKTEGRKLWLLRPFIVRYFYQLSLI